MQDPGTNPPQQMPGQPSSWQSPPQQGYPPVPPPGGQASQTAPSNNKIAAGLCGILLGWLGVHKFILGYTTEGIIMACLSVLSCGIISPIIALIGLVEGIVYLTKSDEEFMQTYVYNKKPWF